MAKRSNPGAAHPAFLAQQKGKGKPAGMGTAKPYSATVNGKTKKSVAKKSIVPTKGVKPAFLMKKKSGGRSR